MRPLFTGSQPSRSFAPRWRQPLMKARINPALSRVISSGIPYPSWASELPAHVMADHEVPVELQEAAQIDGANGSRRFWYITLPSISPVLLFSTIIGIIQSLQLFTQPYVVSTIVGNGSGIVANNLGYPQNSMLFWASMSAMMMVVTDSDHNYDDKR